MGVWRRVIGKARIYTSAQCSTAKQLRPSNIESIKITYDDFRFPNVEVVGWAQRERFVWYVTVQCPFSIITTSVKSLESDVDTCCAGFDDYSTPIGVDFGNGFFYAS